MIQKTVVVVVILAVLTAFTSAAPQRGDEPKGGPGAEPDFTGKVLVVTLKDPAHGGVLQKAKVQRLGGRTFLVGQYVKRNDNDPFPEENVWLPVDDILGIREFKSVDDVRKSYDAAGK